MATSTILQPSNPTMAARHFAWRLRFETDPYDVMAQLEAGSWDLVLVDTRSAEDFRTSHLPGAISVPLQEMNPALLASFDAGKRYVTYAADPACNGATKGAMEMAAAGLVVQELLGGFEYWIKAGYPITV